MNNFVAISISHLHNCTIAQCTRQPVRDYSPRDYFRPQKLHVVIYVKVCGLFFEDFCKISAVLSIIVVPSHLKIEEMIVNKLKIDEKF